MRILVVENDSLLGDAIRAGLEELGDAVDWVRDGVAAEQALETVPYAAIVLDLGLPRRTGLEVLQRLRARQPNLTAVIAMHDRLAFGCIDGAHAVGLSCPNDISVVGFGDLPLTDRTTPTLSTMRLDYRRVGRIAADLMIRTIDEPASPALHHMVDPVLVRRASIAPRRTP